MGVELARTKKCDECKKDCIKKDMVQIDYMTRKGDVKTKMYCSMECATAKETRKQLIEDTNNLLESILAIFTSKSSLVNHTYTFHMDIDLIDLHTCELFYFVFNGFD